MTLLQYYIRFLGEMLDGTRPLPEGMTLHETDEMRRAMELQAQIARLGIPAFVRMCAEESGIVIPEEEYESFDPAALAQALSQMPAGLYKLYVTAYAVGGQNSATSESLFGIPAAEPDPTEAPVPDVTAEPTQPGWEQPQIEYLDPDSDPEAIRYVQLRLYQEGLLRVDDMQEGVLDYATLSAIAAFQQRANELYGLNLTVIDPTVDNIVDFETLTALFQAQGA